MKNETDILNRVYEAAGSKYRLAKLLGIKKQAVQTWRRIPVERVIDVERITGISRHDLRPDLSAVFRDSAA